MIRKGQGMLRENSEIRITLSWNTFPFREVRKLRS